VAVSEDDIRAGTEWLTRATGIDAAPEGGCAAAVLRRMAGDGRIDAGAHVVVFNTGSGASYRA
jgi:threonine synthase